MGEVENGCKLKGHRAEMKGRYWVGGGGHFRDRPGQIQHPHAPNLAVRRSNRKLDVLRCCQSCCVWSNQFTGCATAANQLPLGENEGRFGVFYE